MRAFLDTYFSEALFYEVSAPSKSYVTILVDDGTNYLQTYSMNSKLSFEISNFVDKTLEHYNAFHKHKLLELRVDKGTKFKGLDEALIHNKILYAPTGDKQRNGKVERLVGIHKTQREVITAHLPLPLKAKFFDYSVQHATNLLNFAYPTDKQDSPYNLYHNRDKVPSQNIPMFLEDVLGLTQRANTPIQFLGVFLGIEPDTFICHILLQTGEATSSYTVIFVSHTAILRTFKLLSVKGMISPTLWSGNEKLWGKRPNDWKTTFIDLLQNKTLPIVNEVSYFEKLHLGIPAFSKTTTDDVDLANSNNDPHRKFDIYDKPLQCQTASIFIPIPVITVFGP